MAQLLQAGVYGAGLLVGGSLLLLALGLVMAARPELFAGLGLGDPAKLGLEIALGAGFGAIAAALLGRILRLLRTNLVDDDQL